MVPHVYRILTAAWLTALLALQAGCKGPESYGGHMDDRSERMHDPRIEVNDVKLRKRLRFGEPRVVRDQDLLQVAVSVRNKRKYRYLIDYRYVFYDGDRMEIDYGKGWRQVELLPGQTRQVQDSALDARAVDWGLNFRWSEP